MQMFTVRNINCRQNSFVAIDEDDALRLALETVTVWHRKDLTVTQVPFPQHLLNICERDRLTGLFTTTGQGKSHKTWIGG